MPKSRKLDDRLEQLRAEAVKMTRRAERSPLVTKQRVMLARIVWLVLRQHDFTPANTLERRDGFMFSMNPQWLDEQTMVEVHYYRKDEDEVRCGEALERIYSYLQAAVLPVLGPSNTELIIHANREPKAPKRILVINILCPPQHLLEALYRRLFSRSG